MVFTAVFTDSNGGADISEADMYVMSGVKPGSGSGWAAHECIVRSLPAADTFGVVVDADNAYSDVTPPGVVASNSQCSIYTSGSSATVSGNTLTVKFNISFNGSLFFGAKQIYLAAGTPWSPNFQQQFASWTVPPGQGTYGFGPNLGYIDYNVTDQTGGPCNSGKGTYTLATFDSFA